MRNVDPTILYRMQGRVFWGHRGYWNHLIPYPQHSRIGSYTLESDLHCREGWIRLMSQDTLLLGDKPNHRNVRHQL